MLNDSNPIEEFRAQIVDWRSQGVSLRVIAKRLQDKGLDVDHNQVRRYCVSREIPVTPPTEPPADAKPSKEILIAEAPIESFTRNEHSSTPNALIDRPTPPSVTTQNISHPTSSNSANTPDLQGVRTLIPEKSSTPDKPTLQFTMTPRADFPVVTYGKEVIVLPVPARSAEPPHKLLPENTPKPATASAPAPPKPPAPWRPPPPLYQPLALGPWWTADLPLLGFGSESEQWFLPDALEGTFILGATGSGKSTGSGRTIALSFLNSGFGGLVLTVKPEERATWERYAAQTGRTDQLCIVEPGGRFRLNFLDYEARRPGVGAGLIENLVSLFYTVMDVHAHGGGGDGDRALQNFWTNAGKQLLRNAFRVLTLATPRLSLEDTCKFIAQAPSRVTEVENTNDPQRAFFYHCMALSKNQAKGTPQERVIEEARRFWLQEFPSLAAETRSCIVTAFSAMADGFIEPAIHELFCSDTTIIPEDVKNGAIILVDLSLKRYDTVGLFTQSIWKYLFQKAIERRDDPDSDNRRPVFLWIDEAQYFYSSYDGLFQSTARSSRCATVYITQNISSFYGLTSGHRAKEKVDGFLGHLNTKIFHANNDPASNIWAADQIGRTLTHRLSTSASQRDEGERRRFFGMGRRSNTSASSQEVIEYEVLPSAFINLRTGGTRNKGQIDAYFVKGGSRFQFSGRHYFQTIFLQEQL